MTEGRKGAASSVRPWPVGEAWGSWAGVHTWCTREASCHGVP